MGWGTFLAAMAGPLTARVLMALGFAVVSITGVTATLDALRDAFTDSMNQVPADALNLALLAGVGQAMGIIFGALATRVALWQIQRATRIVGIGS